jgi:hypothetical protein
MGIAGSAQNVMALYQSSMLYSIIVGGDYAALLDRCSGR